MATFIKYLMAFVVQAAWQRTGKHGAIPPMRIPFGKNKGQSVPLPVIGPWQMMIAMWVARQLWIVYGNGVKAKLQNARHPLVKHIGTLLPDSGKNPATVTPAPAPVASTPTPASATTPAPKQYGTRPLDADTDNGKDSGNLPPGALLNSLRSLN